MKRVIVILLAIAVHFSSDAQTNTFPPSGNVGIGTTSPSVPLHVKGKLLVETNDDDVLTFENTDNSWQYLQFNRSSVRQAWLGLNDLSDFYITKNTPGHIQFYPVNGNVGINYSNPPEKLSVGGNVMVYGDQPYVQLKDRLTLQVTSTQANDWTRSLVGHNIRWNAATEMWKVDNGPYADFSMVRFENGGSIGFYVRNYSGPSYEISNTGLNDYKRMVIHSNGNVGIGTADPQAKLAVNGDIFSKKVKVTQTGWPDYVFQPAYRLRPLSEVEKFIQQHGHLPEVPSAAEVEKDGLDLGSSQVVLLKKIEELTLYLIEQDKNLKAQKRQLDWLEKLLQQLIKENTQLKEFKTKVNKHSEQLDNEVLNKTK